MYLTQMALNPERRSTRELVSSPQRLHAAVLSGFVPGTSDQSRILWRLDRPERHRLDLYIVSPVAPSLEAMADQAGWPSQPMWRTADYRPFLEGLEIGQRWIFRLRANPIRNVRPAPKVRGHRVPVVHVEGQMEWLRERGKRFGFGVEVGEFGPNLRISDHVRTRFARHSDGQARTVTIDTVAFEGVLAVTDADHLREALMLGIGAGKGYGCGLLTLAPVP